MLNAQSIIAAASAQCGTELSKQAIAVVNAICEELNRNGQATGNVCIIKNQKALERVEERIKWLRGYAPLPKDSPMFLELDELKVERRRLMTLLGFKA